MTVTTYLSRHTRAIAKTLSIDELNEKKNYCYEMAMKWMIIPNGHQQANKFWDGVSFYENLIDKLNK